MGLLPLTYRRPRYVSRESFRDSDSATLENDKSDTSLKSGTSGRLTGIPEHLAFDKIIKDGTCPVSDHMPQSQLSERVLMTCNSHAPSETS
jgi:hypothetical protein